MNIHPYAAQQLAAAHRADRHTAAVAARLAREVRRSAGTTDVAERPRMRVLRPGSWFGAPAALAR